MKKRSLVWLFIVGIIVLGLGTYLYSQNRSQKAIEDAMQQAVDACATGNKLLTDERVVHAHSVFRAELNTSDAYMAENRLHNRLVFAGCARY